MPILSTDRPANVATPFTAATVTVPDSVPGPPVGGVPLVIASVTGDVSEVTVLPSASCTVTFGCVANATPPVELLGCWVKASFAGVPALMLNDALVAAV